MNNTQYVYITDCTYPGYWYDTRIFSLFILTGNEDDFVTTPSGPILKIDCIIVDEWFVRPNIVYCLSQLLNDAIKEKASEVF